MSGGEREQKNNKKPPSKITVRSAQKTGEAEKNKHGTQNQSATELCPETPSLPLLGQTAETRLSAAS